MFQVRRIPSAKRGSVEQGRTRFELERILKAALFAGVLTFCSRRITTVLSVTLEAEPNQLWIPILALRQRLQFCGHLCSGLFLHSLYTWSTFWNDSLLEIGWCGCHSPYR